MSTLNGVISEMQKVCVLKGTAGYDKNQLKSMLIYF